MRVLGVSVPNQVNDKNQRWLTFVLIFLSPNITSLLGGSVIVSFARQTYAALTTQMTQIDESHANHLCAWRCFVDHLAGQRDLAALVENLSIHLLTPVLVSITHR